MPETSPSWFDQVGSAWNQFWYTPADERPLAAVRILTACGLLVYLLTWGDLSQWLGTDGYLPGASIAAITRENDGNTLIFRGAFLPGVHSSTMLQIYRGLMFVAAACLAFGVATRFAAVATWVLVLLFLHRFSVVTGPCEQLLATLLFYVTLHPGLAYWSVDSRRTNALPEPTQRANIVLRLLQIHVALLVFTMAESKLAGGAWWDGDAVWYLTAQTVSRPLNLTFLRPHEYFLNAWTHFIVLAEVAFPLLVWNRLCRPVVMTAVALAWLSLVPLTGEWLLPVFLAAGIAAFVPTEWLGGVQG